MLSEAPVATLLPPLDPVSLVVDGFIYIIPPTLMIVFLFAPADDSLAFFSNAPGVWSSSASIVISEAPVSTFPPLGVYGSFKLSQSPCCMFVIFTPAEDYLFV